MTPAMKRLYPLLIACSLAAAAPAAMAAAPSPELYSFTDIARLTEAGLLEARFAAADPAEPRVRFAARPVEAEPRFAVGPLREPGRWVLLLAGLAAAGWVAHRRLTHAF
jgi:hypothetical protein